MTTKTRSANFAESNPRCQQRLPVATPDHREIRDRSFGNRSLIGALPATLSCSLVLLLCGASDARDTAEDVEFFEKRIRPVLVEHCFRCHAADAKKIRGGLLLDTREGMRRGGESGPAVVPGNPAESLLLESIRYESYEMPPDGQLPREIIADFEAWIRRGAADPRDGPTKIFESTIDIQKAREFWSLQPIRQSEAPPVDDTAWPTTKIDQYILARLEAAGLHPSQDADRATLIRRAYFALIGLPPTPEAIDGFVHDPKPISVAFAEVVDRLLESKHFGERWGRRWLDVVRFAESSGGGRTLLFPDAWRYRDYVIDAFNSDRPYDLFIKEQIAGDLMPAGDWQQRRRQILATAFLVLGPTNYELQDKELLEMDIVDEQLDTMGKALLGMTLGCARCHDHKFDPIPMHDYYAMAGVLRSTKSVIHSNVSMWNTTELPVPPEEAAALKQHQQQLKKLQQQLTQLQQALVAAGGKVAKSRLPALKSVDPNSLPGIVIDDQQAQKKGKWISSTSVAGFVAENYLHDDNQRAEIKTVSFVTELPKAGEYEVRITFTPASNRSPKVPVTLFHADGQTVIHVDQTKTPSVADTIESLGVFRFDSQSDSRVIISNDNASPGVVIADAVMFIARGEGTPSVQPPLATQPDRPQETLAAARTTRDDKTPRDELSKKIADLEKEIHRFSSAVPKLPVAMTVTDEDEVGDVHLAIRGEVHNQGPLVPRGFLKVVSEGGFPSIPDGQSGRLQLAEWIVNPSHPLTARVMVNRVWYWLYGQGLVRTVDNFGSTGDTPSHPDLLNYLAVQFVNDGWSVKSLIRRMMLSRVYQLSSQPHPQLAEADPDNRLWWRMIRQRLDAECIRDTLLYVGGGLDLRMGGSNIKPGTQIEYGYQFDSPRRSVYLPVFRNVLPQIFKTFDFADPNIQSGKRTTSTIAPQALLLMNHPFVMQQSQAAAAHLLERGSLTLEERILLSYRQVLGREPSDRELEGVRNFVSGRNDTQGWSLLYQTLFQSLDFRYVN